MEEIVTIIGNTCLKHHDSGEASVNREARLIIQALKEKGYEIIQVKNKSNSNSKCCNAIVITSIADEGTGCYVCSKCNKPSDIIPVQSKGKSIEECKDEVARDYHDCKWEELSSKGKDNCIDKAMLLYAQSQPQQIGEWISVKDKLPEEKVKVLICLTYGSGREEIQTSYYVKRTKSFDHFMNDIITHWMPLPSSPQNKNKFRL